MKKSLSFLVNDSELFSDSIVMRCVKLGSLTESSVVCFMSQCDKDCASVLQRELLEPDVPDITKRVSGFVEYSRQRRDVCF